MAKFKGLVKSCEVCGSEFKTPQSQAHVRTCSVECGYKIRRVANKKDKVELKCAHCGGLFFERECHADRRKFCSMECKFASEETRAQKAASISGDKNPAWNGGVSILSVSSSGVVYRRQQKHLEIEKVARRKRAQGLATPAWADLDAIRAVYEAAQKLSEVTATRHHVDHLVPLKSATVCGLHNQFNLSVVPQLDNLKKGNRHWPDMW